MTLEKYFHIIHNLLERHWLISRNEIVFKRYSEHSGKVEGKIILLDGSYVAFAEEIAIVKNAVIKNKYRYQYVKNTEIFRYDNYPRHRGIFPPFHHKHTGDGVAPLPAPPKLIDIIEEAARHML